MFCYDKPLDGYIEMDIYNQPSKKVLLADWWKFFFRLNYKKNQNTLGNNTKEFKENNTFGFSLMINYCFFFEEKSKWEEKTACAFT